MKKVLFLIFTIVTLFTSIHINAQAYDVRRSFKLGVELGVLPTSRFDFSGYGNPDLNQNLTGNKFGFFGSIYGEFRLNKLISLAPEISYVYAGGNNHTWNYIYVTPVQIKFYPYNFINIQIGAFVSYFLNSDCPSLVPDKIERICFGLQPGIEFVYNQDFSIAVEYSAMLTDLDGSPYNRIRQNFFKIGILFHPDL